MNICQKLFLTILRRLLLVVFGQGVTAGIKVNHKVLETIDAMYAAEVQRLTKGKSKYVCLNAALLMFLRSANSEKLSLMGLVRNLEDEEFHVLSSAESPQEREASLAELEKKVRSQAGIRDEKKRKTSRARKKQK